MKAYISGALMGSKDLIKSRKLYLSLGAFCSQNGINPYIPHLNTDPDEYPDIPADIVFKRDFDNLISSQIMVCYIGEPSLGVGAEIVFAIEYNLKIISVIEKENKASRFIIGLLMNYDNHTSIVYSNTQELGEKISRIFKSNEVKITI